MDIGHCESIYSVIVCGSSIRVTALRGRLSNVCFGRRRFSQCECYSSEGKGILQSGAKEYHKTIPYNRSHTRDLLGGENPGGWLPLLVRSSRELGRMQDLCRGSGEGSLGLEGLCGLILWQHWLATLDSSRVRWLSE